MTCVAWGTYPPGSHLGVLGTNVIPIGCAGAPCQTSCADSYVKAIDLVSFVGGAVFLAAAAKAQGKVRIVLFLLGLGLLIFGLLSLFVLPNVQIPGLFGTSTLEWY